MLHRTRCDSPINIKSSRCTFLKNSCTDLRCAPRTFAPDMSEEEFDFDDEEDASRGEGSEDGDGPESREDLIFIDDDGACEEEGDSDDGEAVGEDEDENSEEDCGDEYAEDDEDVKTEEEDGKFLETLKALARRVCRGKGGSESTLVRMADARLVKALKKRGVTACEVERARLAGWGSRRVLGTDVVQPFPGSLATHIEVRMEPARPDVYGEEFSVRFTIKTAATYARRVAEIVYEIENSAHGREERLVQAVLAL